MLVSTLLHAKGGDVATVRPDASVESVVGRLKTERVGALVVSDDGHRINGIVSERDVVRRLHANGPSALSATVADLMTTGVVTCAPDDDAAGLAGIMTERRFRHLPVVVDGELVGIVSIGDLVKARIDMLEQEREQLQSYIAG